MGVYDLKTRLQLLCNQGPYLKGLMSFSVTPNIDHMQSSRCSINT